MASETTSYTGRVKWFNNKSGYGFVTIVDGDRSGDDVFAHHSGICVSSEQYRYLVQGEYITFTLKETTGGQHSVQAWDIHGVCGGPLMCETRKEVRDSRPPRQDTGGQTRYHGGGPRDGTTSHGTSRRTNTSHRDNTNEGYSLVNDDTNHNDS